MENIVAEIVEELKSGRDRIDVEKRVHRLLEAKCREAVREALELVDGEFWEELKAQGAKSLRRDNRTLVTSYGEVRFKRRLVMLEDGSKLYPLDKELGFEKYQRISPCLQFAVARIASKSTYRATAMSVAALTSASLSHTAVGKVVKTVGGIYGVYEKTQSNCETASVKELAKPEVLRIEGDAIELKSQDQNHMSLHRYQIAEGVRQCGKRRELVCVHCVASLSRTEAMKQMQSYIESHYDLSHTLVLSNSDGGSGYGKEVFDEILGRVGRHEHFRDTYHVNEKCRQRLSFAPGEFVNEFQRMVWRHNREEIAMALDTAESMAENEQDLDNVKKLRAYLERNWEYLTPLSQRGTGIAVKGIGACESNHRLYSYRMKRQGRRWGRSGGEGMAKIIAGLRNGDLEKALDSYGKDRTSELSPSYKNAVRNALKKCKPCPHVGAHNGVITTNCPRTSAIGNLAQCINAGGMAN